MVSFFPNVVSFMYPPPCVGCFPVFVFEFEIELLLL